MLRDLLVQLPGLVTWPCDEINYIWRHGNRGFQTDEFTPDMASEKTTAFVQSQFKKLIQKNSEQTIVEKTCANSLRCSFVHKIFPEARFIHIVRDGRDVAASAALRWNAKLEPAYLIRKARFVPMADIPYYAGKYFSARMYRLFSGRARLSTWGPKFDGMTKVFQDQELVVGCAHQWKVCVESARRQLSLVPGNQVIQLSYESFAKAPVEGMQTICKFLGLDIPIDVLRPLTASVSTTSVGKWRKQLNRKQLTKIQELAGELLLNLGYDLESHESIREGQAS